MPMGFNPKKKLQNDINDFNDILNGGEISKKQPTRNEQPKPPKPSPSTYNEDEDLGFTESKPEEVKTKKGGKMNKLIGIFIVITIVALIAIIAIIAMPNKSSGEVNRGSAVEQSSDNTKPSGNTNEQSEQEGDQQASASFEDDDSINPGISDTNQDVDGTSPNQNPTDAKDFTNSVTDLNGNKIDSNYVVSSREVVTDYVNYEKKRGITSNGLELYWLDVTYKDNPYVIQVPYQTWSNLDSKGTTVVDMEVLNIDDGSQVISYMQLKGDINDIINRAEEAEEGNSN